MIPAEQTALENKAPLHPYEKVQRGFFSSAAVYGHLCDSLYPPTYPRCSSVDESYGRAGYERGITDAAFEQGIKRTSGMDNPEARKETDVKHVLSRHTISQYMHDLKTAPDENLPASDSLTVNLRGRLITFNEPIM